MKGGAVFIEQMFHIDLHLALLIFTLIVAAYVITGGIKGVLYTDALQAVIMFACMLFLLFWFYRVMDMGFIEANRKLTEIAPLVPERFKEVGHQGWTAMPVTGSPQWYTLVTSLILGVGIGCLAQPQLVVRFMMVESTKQLNRGDSDRLCFSDRDRRSHLSCRGIIEPLFPENRRRGCIGSHQGYG